jgi:hypothetical protein
MTPFPTRLLRLLPVVAAAALTVAGPAQASSHREAPFITTSPKVDASDFYMFRSYETGREGYVTLIANYQPLQDAYGGPNYFSMDPNALYEIHVDNNGDAKEDLSFQFRFKNTAAGVELMVGDQSVGIPLIQAGQVSRVSDPNLNLAETYSVAVVRGDRRTGSSAMLTNAVGGGTSFAKPVDNIGVKTIPDYPAYAAKHIYNVNIPGCSGTARMFVGQRQDSFAVNLGTIFDLVNAPVDVITNPALIGAVPNQLADKNVTTLALEVPISCLTNGSEPVIGAWTTASLRQARLLDPSPKPGHQTTDKNGGAWTQVSRLGMPLVNEVVIGLKDKDHFNGSKPKDDAQFAKYVTNPTLPKLIEIALNLPGTAPTNYPRNDLVTTFLTGISGLNQPANVVALGRASFEHQHRASALCPAEPPGRGGQHPGRWHRLRRFPERPPPQGRCGGRVAGGDDGRLVHGQRRYRRAEVRRGLQALGRAAGGHVAEAA